MSLLIDFVLKSTFNIFWASIRSYTAKQLKDGDVYQEKCREYIMSQLDNIKTKLDGLALQDLFSSLSFLREGLYLLNLSSGTLGDGQQTNPHVANINSPITTNTLLPAACLNELNDASSLNENLTMLLTQAVDKFKTISHKNFTSAKDSFKNANVKATEAFSNHGLKIKYRILAAELRIISKILESLENPEATGVCIAYLEELHAMSAVEKIFSVFVEKGLISKFKPYKRCKYVVSVTAINFLVYDFTKRFVSAPIDLWKWPTITVNGQLFNPVLANEAIMKRVRDTGLQIPNVFTIQPAESLHTWISAVNSKGEIISPSARKEDVAVSLMKIRTGLQVRLFAKLPEEAQFEILAIAIDEQDNVYVLASVTSRRRNFFQGQCYELLIVDKQGVVTHRYTLPALDETFEASLSWPTMAVTLGQTVRIVIHKDGKLFLYNSEGKLDNEFQLHKASKNVSLCISDENEIIVVPYDCSTVYIYNEDGELQREFQPSRGQTGRSATFSHVTKQVLILSEPKKGQFVLTTSTKNGEQQHNIQLARGCRGVLASHPTGDVVVVYPEEVLCIQ